MEDTLLQNARAVAAVIRYLLDLSVCWHNCRKKNKMIFPEEKSTTTVKRNMFTQTFSRYLERSALVQHTLLTNSERLVTLNKTTRTQRLYPKPLLRNTRFPLPLFLRSFPMFQPVSRKLSRAIQAISVRTMFLEFLLKVTSKRQSQFLVELMLHVTKLPQLLKDFTFQGMVSVEYFQSVYHLF